MPIRPLPPLLVNQIAAGEVVERPASIVKELVENSLDAGATRVAILVEEGGRQLIRVTDDGGGIPPDELPLAIAPHATSKLNSSEQLASIVTMGFRGEALASIGSVSRLSITSRFTSAGNPTESGYRIAVSGGKRTGGSVPEPVGCAPGSVVEVRDLFFNTPARRKFLRSPQVEFGHISDWVTRVAMARPGVTMRLTHGKRESLDVPSGPSRCDRCVAVLGRELDEALLQFEAADGPSNLGTADGLLSVWGLAGLPAIARATAKFQYLYVNGRPIRDRTIAHALREAYRGLIPADRQPVAVVQIQIDPAAVDVNVHPAKSEVRFHDVGRVHRLVLTAVRQRLLGTDLTPTATIGGTPWGRRHGQAAGEDEPVRDDGLSVGQASPGAFVEYFKRMDLSQKGFAYNEVRQAMASAEVPLEGRKVAPGGEGSAGISGIPEVKSATSPDPQNRLIQSLSPVPPVLQVHNSYLVTQDEQGLVIVDQHALHERVMFEQLLERVLAGSLESQRLLTPAVLPASTSRLAHLGPAEALLSRIGIEVSQIGPDTIGIHGFPSFLFDRGVDPVTFVEELLDRVEEGEILLTHDDRGGDCRDGSTSESALHKVLDMMACKAAIKAGERMSESELANLLQQRSVVDRSGSCPHGRPTTIRVTIRELEKKFKRA